MNRHSSTWPTRIMPLKLLLLCAIVITACSPTSNLKTSQKKLNRQAEMNATSSKLVNKPILAELEISMKRATSTYKTTNIDIANSIITSGSSDRKKSGFLIPATESIKNEARNRAQFKFMDDFKCDYLVDPIYKIETESTSESSIITISVEISAFPAFYKKFSQPDSLPKSVFELNQLDGREIPLITNSTVSNKSKVHSSSGIQFGPNFSKLKSSGGNKIEESESRFGGMMGLWTVLPAAGRIGFRIEGSLLTQSGYYESTSTTSSGTNDITNFSANAYSQFAIQIPLLLNYAPTDKLSFFAGPSINYILASRYNIDYTTTTTNIFTGSSNVNSGTLEGDWETEKLQVGFPIGIFYQTSGSFGIGLRQESRLGVDKWSTSTFLFSFRF